MKVSSACLITTLVAALKSANAFSPASAWSTRASALRAVDDKSAQALSDYMAKSHVEKLKAIKAVEDKKNSEIDALKAEISQLKALQSATGGTIDSPPAIPNNTSTDNTAIAQKLSSYQSFMEEYMINAQNQKLLAIREAELKAEKKFEEKLEKLLAASNAALKESSVDATVLSKKATLFEKRNARIVAAAKAGVSRWGGMEVMRAGEGVKNAPVTADSTPDVTELTLFDQRNARVVAAASAGKSRWGSMEVDRAKNSGAVTSSSTSSKTTVETNLFDQRNARVVAAASAGKSRWGSMEVDRAKNSGAVTSSKTSSKTTVETNLFDQRNARVVAAASAGKSRWGSKEVERAMGSTLADMAPPTAAETASLANRVNVGAQLVDASAVLTSSAIAQSTTLFDQRNAKIVAAACAGKSRWGEMEVDRAKGVVASSSTQRAAASSLFDLRNVKVVAAANAGKARWGNLEVNRAKQSVDLSL